MAAPAGRVGRGMGARLGVVILVVAILAVSVLMSVNLSSGQLAVDAWSNFIAGVQVSTLVVVLAIFVWWVRGRGP